MIEIDFEAKSNRASWKQRFELVNDDDETPIALTNTAGSGTFADWAVTTSLELYGDTLVTSASSTPATIGAGSKTVNVGGGLSTSVGQYVRITANADTSNWMQGQITAYDSVGGNLTFTVASVSITLEIRREVSPRNYSGQGTFFDFTGCEETAVLTATSSDKVTFVDVNVFQLFFTETDMRSLLPGHYAIGCVLKTADGLETIELFRGRFPVVFGGVT